MEENKVPEKKETESLTGTFWNWLDGFLTNGGLPGKLRGMAKAFLVIDGLLIVYLLFILLDGFASLIFYSIPVLLMLLVFAWVLYAVADIHEKTMENNDILRQAFPEYAPKPQEEDPKSEAAETQDP